MSTLLGEAELQRDQDLVRRHQAGDALAFGRLFELHHDRLLRYCRRQVRDAHLAEELAQEAFLRAYRALDRFDGGRSFYPWLTVIARRLIIDHQRRSGRTQPRAEVDPGAVDAFENEIVDRVDHDHVRLALGRVRSRHREVLELRDWEGMSYEAIAQRLGTSTGTVQSLLHRARLALRREYFALVGEQRHGVVALALLSGLRRLRERAGRVSAWMPDGGAIGAPFAAAALSVATLLTPPAAPPQPAATAPDGWTSRMTVADPPSAQVTAAEPQQERDLPGAVPPRAHPEPVAKIAVGPDGVQESRRQTDAMPAVIDAGPAFAGADPQIVVGDTLAATRSMLGGR